MDRKEFLQKTAVVGAAALLDFSLVGKALAQNKSFTTKSGTDLVAVMGGEPVDMLKKAIEALGGIAQYVKPGYKVVLKPNIGWDKTPEMAANTNPDLVAGMVKLCLAAGAKEVVVFDNSCDNWIKCYDKSGIKKAVEAAGGKMVPGSDESYYVDYNLPRAVKLKKIKIHKAILDCDVWFNMPVLKHHGGAKMTVSMKNLMGIVWDRGIFHSTDLQQCIADVNTLAKPAALSIVDAYRVVKDNGPQGKSLADVALLKTLIVSPDPVACDTAAIKFFSQVREMNLDTVSHIAKAEALKVGSSKIDGMNVKRIKI